MILTYTAVFSSISLMRYYTFRTYLDLGIFDQAFASTIHGRLFFETPDLVFIPTGNFLGTHFAPILFLIVPVYALFPFPQTLLVIQTVFVALGAVPVYLVSSHVLKREKVSLLLTTLYFLNPAVQSLNLFDFHLEAFLPLFLGMFFYSLIAQKWRSYVLYFCLSIVTIEFAPIMVGAMCLSVLTLRGKFFLDLLFRSPTRLFSKENFSISVPLVTIAASAACFYGLLYGAGYFAGTHLLPQQQLVGFFGGLAQVAIPDKVIFWILSLGSFSFLPLRSGRRLIMIAPWAMVSIITSIHPFVELGYQYGGAFVAPYLLLCTVYAIPKIKDRLKLRRLLAIALIVSAVLSPINPLMGPVIAGIAYEDGLPIPTLHDGIVAQTIGLVPNNASILVQNNFFTHFTNRPDAFLYLPENTTLPDYILADASSRWYTQPVFDYLPICHSVIDGLVSGLYGLIIYQDGVVLLKKGQLGLSPSAEELYTLYFSCPLDAKACPAQPCRPTFLLPDNAKFRTMFGE